MSEQTYIDPVNYFEGDRVRITDDPLMKSKTWVGKTGTVTKGSGRRWNEGVNVRLDTPIGKFDTIWFRHSEVEFEDNRTLRPLALFVGDYVRTNGSPTSCIPQSDGNYEYINWVRSESQIVDLTRAKFVKIHCIGCDWHDTIDASQIESVSFMCDQPALPDGSYHADLNS